MSGSRKICTDGEALTTVEGQRVADIAAKADDLALEGLFTPGATQKKVVPLLDETSSILPFLLCVPGGANGTVAVKPSLFLAGGASLPYQLALSGKLLASTDSGLFGSNSSGSDRYDLLYASIARAVDVTGSRKVKNITTGVVTSQTLNLQSSPVVTLGIVVGTSSSSGPALPADAVDGSSYNFPLAVVKLANGFTSGSAIAAANIAQAWSGGWLSQRRTQRILPVSLYAGAATEKPGGIYPSSRWGQGFMFAAHFKLFNSTSMVILDSTINYANRLVKIDAAYLGSGANNFFPFDAPAFGGAVAQKTLGPMIMCGAYGQTQVDWANYAGASLLRFKCDSSNRLCITGSAVQDNTNGDPFACLITVTDPFVTGI